MTKISLLHPSRSRPQKSYNTIQKWVERAGTEVEVIISLDTDDPNKLDYVNSYVPIFNVNIIFNTNRSAVDAINNAAKQASGDIFIVVSDDTDCPENWAIDLLKHLEGKEDFIAKVDDGIQPWIITMPIMDRKYYDRFGYVYHPDFLHMFVDTHLSCVADLTGRRITIPMKFAHLHYSTGASVKDAVSYKADSTWDQGEQLFLKNYENNFGLVDPPGKITDIGIIKWVQKQRGII
jgi:hypothetical protein